MSPMNEDTLVQQTTADYLKDSLRWDDSVLAWNHEDFGPDSLLGRKDDTQVVLTRYLRKALIKLNPGLEDEAYDEAVKKIEEFSASASLLQVNKEKYEMFTDRVEVQVRDEDGKLVKKRLRVFDFDNPDNNHFLAVRELWIRGPIYRKRADIVGFVNGLPLIFIECKNINRSLESAYRENISDYKDTIPHAFHHNAVILLGNGNGALIGTVTSPFEYFDEWKRLREEDPGVVDMETLLKGVCHKKNFMDIFENFIVFDTQSKEEVKIVARNHQFLGVNSAIEAVKNRTSNLGKLGVFWHTQRTGKSYSMVFFSKKVHRKISGDYTFLICTDREDLDKQIYKTFAGCGLVDNDKTKCRASSGQDLKNLLNQHKQFVFSLIHKFNQDVDSDDPYNTSENIIVITDEAHRSQYGRLARNMRDALPNAAFIGFTGTPLMKEDEITKRIFGDYVSVYDFQRAREDNVTVKLIFDPRGKKLKVARDDINELIADKIEELEIDDIDVQQRLEQAIRSEYVTFTAEERLRDIAKDFVEHYSTNYETGKAMLVCIDKITCVRMYNLIEQFWLEKIENLKEELASEDNEGDKVEIRQKIKWMEETVKAVVVSEEQGEVEKFRKWDLDIQPHRKIVRDGFEVHGAERIDVETAFKDDDHPFRVAIVCAMWLTGFDVPSLSTLYLDKPMKAHTLMQAISRPNTKHKDKVNGLVVDYCNILKSFREALATYAGQSGDGGKIVKEVDPVKPQEELLEDLKESLGLVMSLLSDDENLIKKIMETTGFERNRAILDAKEEINTSDSTRKRFEITAREFFRKYKACLTVKGVNEYRTPHDAIKIVYNSLDEDKKAADISHIIRELHKVVSKSIQPEYESDHEDAKPYDISGINFERLKQEFQKAPGKKTIVQNLRDAIEKRLERMIRENPTRINFQSHYEEMIEKYNKEKDRLVIEQTFEELLSFVNSLDEEEQRNVREGLDVETQTLFDLLKKEPLAPKEIKKLKEVAQELLTALKAEKLKENWREKSATRDSVKTAIYDFLYSDETGLPESYAEDEIEEKANVIFQHIFQFYPTKDHIYGSAG
jgi:type I restriction enzyme R subunit